jgi:DNA-binding beta-propeller fold protein YncE
MRIRRLLSIGLACSAASLAACSTNPTGDEAVIAVKSKPTPVQVPKSDNPYTLFETLQVRPLALSPNGKLLFAANTPDNRLEIFQVGKKGLKPRSSVQVGLEPVAVAVRNDQEVWVVNHLSDSVSIVDVSDPNAPRVTRTLLVGDEPRDIVFGGADKQRAFITTAHRGQNADDPELFTPGVGRADVWVFDACNLGDAAGGQRLTKLTFFADSPRALAVTPDGTTVYVAAFLSGNQTSAVSTDAVRKVYGGTMPTPNTISFLGMTLPQPPTGLVVKYKFGADGQYHWLDANGAVFDDYVKIRLPDHDVFAIDATANPPQAVAGSVYDHVGTTLFNAAINPKSGKLYVSNTDAHNDVRFEGHNAGVSSVRGNIVDSRISVIDPAAKSVSAINLNPHIDHAADTGDASLSVAFPQDLTVTPDGKQLLVVAQGSSKLAIYDTAELEKGNAAPSAASQVALSGGGPTGVVLGSDCQTAFVLNRFDNSISVVDLGARTETAHVTMFNPEPASVTTGRKFLYDATHTSKHGDQACASCHIGGDFDGLAWDLGNPGGIPLSITTVFKLESDVFTIPIAAITALLPEVAPEFKANNPLKGPMTTQSLRGMDNHGSMHWRGDRNGAVQQTGLPFIDPATGQPVVSQQPNGGIFDEVNAFKSFNVAFPGLLGNDTQLADGDIQAFTDFILQVTYPPNPIRNLDNSLTAEQQRGHDFFFNAAPDGTPLPSDRFKNCNGCHTLDRNGNAGASRHPGFFGTDGRLSFEFETQIFKVPHLRNMYQKVGMFGSSPDPITVASTIPPLNPVVDATRGFAFQHDGVVGSPEHFFSNQVFVQSTTPSQLPNGNMAPPNPYGIPLLDPTTGGISTDGLALRRALSAFVLAFDSNMLPIVGQQITLTAADAATAGPRIDLLEARAQAGECDLVVSGHSGGRSLGFVYANGVFVQSTTTLASLDDATLRGLVKGGCQSLTFTCVPPGSGWRIGVDRDGDGWADADELAAGTNPADPNSHP